MEQIFFLISLFFSLWTCILAMDNLNVVYEWKQVDFAFPSEEARRQAIASAEFIPANNLPLGLEVYGDRLFITVPRWKSGVPASLTYINLSEQKDSPKLKPYPNWSAHNLSGTPQVVSPFRIRADRCGRLWVLDTGLEDLLGTTRFIYPTRVLIYDLTKDVLLRMYEIPKSQAKNESLFANIAVEDHDCDNSFAYLGDVAGKSGLVVYSWKDNRSWRVDHHFFNIEPLSGEFNVSGIIFEWSDGLFGMALSRPDPEGYSTLYFHPLSSTDEFAVNTRFLREEAAIKTSFHNYTHLGSRGPKGQSGVSFLDQKTDVLFYGLVNLNAVACWRTTNRSYTMESQGRVYMSSTNMVFPNDIKVDARDTLWVLSDRLPEFIYRDLSPYEVNFRVLNASVSDAIRGTACDKELVIPQEVIRKYTPVINVRKMQVGDKRTPKPPTSAAGIPRSVSCVTIAILLTLASVLL